VYIREEIYLLTANYPLEVKRDGPYCTIHYSYRIVAHQAVPQRNKSNLKNLERECAWYVKNKNTRERHL
jgi:hypothetical protein